MIFIMFLLFGSNTIAQPNTIEVKDMQHYYYFPERGEENQNLKKGANCFVLTTRKEMDKMFGKTDRPDTPDFKKEWMLVILMPKAKWHNIVDMELSATLIGTSLMVFCKVKESNKKLTYDHNPIKVCTVPHFKQVKTIIFHSDKHQRIYASIPVK